MPYKISLERLWSGLRTVSGDDAYERYLLHRREHHADATTAPLSRSEFFKAELERKWNGVRRCC